MGQRNASFKIAIFPRLHLTLLSMHAGEYRKHGGIGFSIADPLCTISARRSDALSVQDLRSRGFSNNDKAHLIDVLAVEIENMGFGSAIELSIEGQMWTHFGYGSTTAITLASLELLHHANECTPRPDHIITASGRGGTSGIGINTYFSGGLIFDLGHSLGNRTLVPSHQARDLSIPLLLDRVDMPAWDVGICIPLAIHGKTLSEEEAFFEKVCPIPANEVYETAYHVIFGLYASVREGNWSTFCSALRNVQNGYWKSAERAEYGEPLFAIEQKLYASGAAAVCMSSLGPVLFFLAENVENVIRLMRLSGAACDYQITRPINHGRSFPDA